MGLRGVWMNQQKNIPNGKSSFDLIDQEKFFRELEIKEDTIFLDAVCGCGDYALAAASRIGEQGRIYAFDLQEGIIDRLTDKIVAEGITNVVPRVAGPLSLPLGNNTIDICLMVTAFYDLVPQGDDEKALSEITRVLKPSGVLAVIEFKKIPGHLGSPINIRIRSAELDETLRFHGFTSVKPREIKVGEYSYLSLYRKDNWQSY